MGENSRTPKDVLVNCKQISGLIRQQHSNHRYSASVILDDLKEIHAFLLKEASTSFGCNYDEGGNSALGERYSRVAYGILPDLVSHVLKMDPQTDGDFEKMYKMVIDIFCCLTAVCPVELMPFLFSTFASLLLYFNENEKKISSSVSKLQSIVMYKLCYYMFPLCLVHPRSDDSCHAMVPAVISSVLDTCRGEDTKWCLQLMDILMSLKKGICLDVITVISSGTQRVRKQAEKILIHYWLRPQEKQNGEEILKAWELVKCSWCPRAGDLVCINFACTTHLHDKTSESNYLHFCTYCYTRQGACENTFRIAKPIGIEDRLSGSCQLGNCHRIAALACFHSDCISLAKISQSFVRMCSECAASCHENSDSDHIFQDGLQCPWTCQDEITRIAFLGALSKLLEDILVAYQNNSKEVQSLDYENMAAVIMLDQYCQCPACELDDDVHNWVVHLVSLVLNWLSEIFIVDRQQSFFIFMVDRQQSNVVGKIIIPWLVRALQQEVKYVAEAVLPNLPSYAQVGRLWNSVHSVVECRKHTLEIIGMLQNRILVDGRTDLFYQVFDYIIPCWLKELSSSPDQLEELKDYFKQLFETSKDDTKRKFNFINTTLGKKDVHETKEALCWLQALTRMNIAIPFLKETIQLSIHKPVLSKISSFDIKASAKHIIRKSSWSDSEFSDTSTVSGLVTRSSVEYTGDILDVDSTLTRYIIMLDVWLSQIKLVKNFSTFQFSDIQGIVLTMLRDSQNWGSFHNHNCPSEICLLCYAIVLWFNLANQTFERYTPPVPVQCVYGEDEQLQPAHRSSRTSYFYKFLPLRRMTPMLEHYPIDARASVGSSGSAVEQSSQSIPISPVREKSSPFRRERKIARVDTHTNYTLVSESLQENPNKHAKRMETGKLYKIFQECLKLWRPTSFIPQATHQIILFITTLFRNKLLNDESFYSTYIADVDKLIINLWNSLICEHTYLAKAAVSLLYECLELLTFATNLPATEDLQEVKFRSMVDSKFEQDSFARRFEVVEKAFLMVQFTENVKKLSCQTQLSLSCVFCHLVGSLQDSSSHVTTRAQYCLRSLKKSAVVGVQDAMISAFNHYPNHRSSILMTISLLNSHLNLMFTSPIKFFVGLEPYLKLLKECHTDQRKRKKGKGLEEKLSVASHSVQIMNEYLNSEQSNAAILQQILSLLMQVLAHPEFKATLLDEVAIEIPISSSAGQEKEKEKLLGLTVIMDFFRLIVCQHFVPLPEKLRESHFFETYLRNIYQVLDVNTTFGNSPEVLLFNLQLLIFSACPTYNDYQSLSERIKQTNITLVLLDSTLCLAWLKAFFVICYKYVLQILQSAEKEKLQDYVVACVMITLNTLQRTAHYCIPTPRQKLKSNSIQEQGLFMAAMPSRNSSVTSNDSGSSSLTLTSSRQGDGQKCPLCNAVIGNTLGEEIITQCVITLSIALHHMPVLTSRYLIEGINALARVALPNRFSWDNTNKTRDQAPNSASNVSKQYLKCLLTQHGDRKLFLYLFKYCDRKELMEAIFISLPPPIPVEQDNSTSLNEGEESSKKTDKPILDQISPVQYFLEDLQDEPSILRKSNVIINLSNYLHLIRDANGKKILYSLIPQFEFFFEKLKHLPKANDIEKAYGALLKIMILLNGVLKEDPPKHGLISRSLVVQQFTFYHCAILSMGFKYTLVPLHGLVVLCSSWYHSLESHSLSYTSLDSIINTLNSELVQVLKLKSSQVNVNALTLLKFFMLCFHGNIGFIDDIFNEAKTIFCRHLDEDQFFNHVVNALPHTTLLECLGFLCSRLSSVHELKLHVSKLLVTNLCSGTPSKILLQRLQQIDTTLKASLSEDRTLQSVLKTGAGYLIVLGWMMVAAIKLTVTRQIFIKQISEASQEWEVDDPSTFLYRILSLQPLVNVNTTVNIVLDLIIKNCNTTGVDKDIIKNLFLFLEIWTVYLEVVLPKGEDNALIVIGLWRNVIQQIHRISMTNEIILSILHHLNKAVAHIKRANLFLTTKITPFWREAQAMGELAEYCTELWKEVGDTEITSEASLIAGNETIEHQQKQTGCCSERGLDQWYNSVIQRLTDTDVDYRTDIMAKQQN